MKWWDIIKQTGAVMSTTAGIDSKPKFSDGKPKEHEEEEEIEKVVGFVAGKFLGDDDDE